MAESNSKLLEDKICVDFDLFKCPVCWDLPLCHVLQCTNGHTVCKRCFILGNMKTCPTCKIPFGPERIRNLVVETVLETLKVDCPFKSKGCNEKIIKMEDERHHQICDFRPVSLCQNLGVEADCQLKVSTGEELRLHLSNTHQAQKEPSRGSRMFINLDRDDSPAEFYLFWSKFDACHFLISAQVTKNKDEIPIDILSIAAFFLGDDPNKANEYLVDFKIFPFQFSIPKRSKLQWTVPPVHYKKAEDKSSIPVCSFPVKYLMEQLGGCDLALNHFIRLKKIENV